MCEYGNQDNPGRRAQSATGAPAAAGGQAQEAEIEAYAAPAEPALPDTDFELDRGRAALVVVDPLVDFLHPDGVAWPVVGDNVQQLGTVDNLERLLVAAQNAEMPVLVSPHYYYPHDHDWDFAGPLEAWMHGEGMFDIESRFGSIEGTGADFLPQLKPYFIDGRAVICSPHKVYGPQSNDVVLQLRKRGIEQVVLAGMSANLCVESHLRDLLEQGLRVGVVTDATAAAQVPEGDGYLAALINFRFIANGIWTTQEAVAKIDALATSSPARH